VELAKPAAPEIDRLVWTVSRGVAPRHGTHLQRLAAEVGLDTLGFLPLLADFLLAGTAGDAVIARRMPYRSHPAVTAGLDELTGKGLIARHEDALVATERLVPLLEAIRAGQADVAAITWAGFEAQVVTASRLARKIALAATDDHAVAVVHRSLPAPADQYLLLFDHLVTLRYIRQQDHVAAWQVHDLTAPAIVTMTELWRGDDAAPGGAGAMQLVARGFATEEPLALTAAGRAVRDEIEEQTDQRAEATFGVLDDAESTTFLSALQQLPGRP
jgi:hypothetical protein